MIASIQFTLAAASRQSSMLVWVLNPKNFILPAFFICAAHSLIGIVDLVQGADAMAKEEVYIVRVQLLQGSSQGFRSSSAGAPGRLFVTRKISFRASGLRVKKRPMPSSLSPLP